jgi:hypothetical protein
VHDTKPGWWLMAIAIDGSATHTISASSTTTSTITSPTTTNNFDRVFISATLNGSTISSITDGLSLTWAKMAGGQLGSGAGNSFEVWYADVGNQNLAAGTITVHYTGTATYISLNCWCVSNGGSSNGLAFDSGGPTTNFAAGGASILSAITTATAACMVIGVFRCQATGGPVMGTGWVGAPSIESGVASAFMGVGYAVETVTGTYTPFLASGSTDVNSVITFGVIAGSAADTLLTQQRLYM